MSSVPRPPLFVLEGRDVQVFPTAYAAEAWLEADDIDDVAISDADGRVVQVINSGGRPVLASAGAVDPDVRGRVQEALSEMLQTRGFGPLPSDWGGIINVIEAHVEDLSPRHQWRPPWSRGAH